MILTGSLIAIFIIIIVAKLLISKYNAQAVLLFSGLFMLLVAFLLGFELPVLEKPTGSGFLDILAKLMQMLDY
jgi:DcuC family C4-dicarboxylate transporter